MMGPWRTLAVFAFGTWGWLISEPQWLQWTFGFYIVLWIGAVDDFLGEVAKKMKEIA